jgi:hypothetical protein
MTNDNPKNSKRPLYIFLAILGIILLLLFLPFSTIEGISLIDKEYIYNKATGMYSIFGQRPEQYAEVYVVSNTFDSDSRITDIRKYYLARLDYDIAVLKKELGEIKKIDPTLKKRRDELDQNASNSIQSIISDASTIKLRTDSEGRFTKNIRPGRYFVLIRSNRNRYETSTEISGAISYKDDIWLLPFQSFRYEQIWKPERER